MTDSRLSTSGPTAPATGTDPENASADEAVLLLDPRGTRSVSYGLHAWPAHALMAWPPATAFVRLWAFPPGSPGPALNSCAFDFA